VTTTTYTVTNNTERGFEAWRETPEKLGGALTLMDTACLGFRPKYRQAQRLCEQSAGQPLDWKKTPDGWIATR
jgi:hypothetical protein